MIKIIYDGACPFCKSYVQIIRLKANVGTVLLINARTLSFKDIETYKANGHDLDQGMLVEYNNKNYFGSNAIHIIALLSSNTGIINRFIVFLFSKQKIANLIYPIFKITRLVTLFVIRQSKLHKDENEKKQ